MSTKASETYVTEVLTLQGVAVAPEAPKAISGALSAQLGAAASAYATIPFEAEPATFLVVQAREKV